MINPKEDEALCREIENIISITGHLEGLKDYPAGDMNFWVVFGQLIESRRNLNREFYAAEERSDWKKPPIKETNK